MTPTTQEIIDKLHTIIGSVSDPEYAHLTDDERKQFMDHVIDAVNILDKPNVPVCKYDSERDERAGSTCPSCHGTRTWCEGCRMWTSLCCEKYGTCMCS